MDGPLGGGDAAPQERNRVGAEEIFDSSPPCNTGGTSRDGSSGWHGLVAVNQSHRVSGCLEPEIGFLSEELSGAQDRREWT